MKFASAIAATACLLGGAANADTLLGEWAGAGTPIGPGYDQSMDLWINSGTLVAGIYQLTGTTDVTCTGSPDPMCGTDGVVAVTGTWDPTGPIDLGTLANPTAFSGTFTGSAPWGGIVTSLDGTQEAWTFTRPATDVPEPATFGLLGMGLALVIAGRRRRNA
jgi:hypothetical protein